MEKYTFSYPATAPLLYGSLFGVVSSGDLEVLYFPMTGGKMEISVETTVDGLKSIWESLFSRFSEHKGFPSGRLVIHDFGSTPGVVKLRMEQALAKAAAEQKPEGLQESDQSFIELGARERSQALLDEGTCKELLGPTENIVSPWLEQQNIIVESDDGMIISKGTVNGIPTVIAAIEGAFQGGSMGEVSGAKMAAALELAAEDNRKGVNTHVILLLETGGVRLQEANLGLAAIADIHSAIVDLRQYVPVIGVITGTVGCFGGMSIAAGLCSKLIVTEEARLGLNGPQVIEQEAGIEEYNSHDRPFIWQMTGGATRYRCGFVDSLVKDSIKQVRAEVIKSMQAGVEPLRSDNSDYYLQKLATLPTEKQADIDIIVKTFGLEERV